jgi:hypothetical protein
MSITHRIGRQQYTTTLRVTQDTRLTSHHILRAAYHTLLPPVQPPADDSGNACAPEQLHSRCPKEAFEERQHLLMYRVRFRLRIACAKGFRKHESRWLMMRLFEEFVPHFRGSSANILVGQELHDRRQQRRISRERRRSFGGLWAPSPGACPGGNRGGSLGKRRGRG